MQINQNCESCGFFIPHYVRVGRKFVLCGLGHCMYARGKQRKPSAPICAQFTPQK